jgi:hypothetical protein
VKFDVAAIFEYIIEKFGLSEKAKNGTVTISITIDGDKLEGKLCHVTIGFKIVFVLLLVKSRKCTSPKWSMSQDNFHTQKKYRQHCVSQIVPKVHHRIVLLLEDE